MPAPMIRVDPGLFPYCTPIQKKRLEAIIEHGGIRAAARALGFNSGTLLDVVKAVEKKAAHHGYRATHDLTHVRNIREELFIPDPPSGSEPIEDLVARKRAQYDRMQRVDDFHRLIPITVRHSGPVAICAVGDPHVDSEHCDIAAIERDMTIIGRTPGAYALHMGDITDNWVGNLARLYAHSSTKASDGVRLAEWMFGMAPPLAVVGGNHDCHDTETEALTKRGWLRHDQITDDDLVLSIDPATGVCDWYPIHARIVREHDGEVVRIETQAMSLSVTPKHRVLHSKRTQYGDPEWSELKYAHADELPSRFALPVSGRVERNGAAITDGQIALAGWILTDGSITWDGNSPKVAIWQSKCGAEIERLLAACALDYRQSIRHREIGEVCGRKLVKEPLPQRAYIMNAETSRKVLAWVPAKGELPAWCDDLTGHQFEVFLDALIRGDGCWDGSDPAAKVCAVLHGERDFLGQVQALAVRHGWNAMMSVARTKDCRLNLAKRDVLQFERGQSVTREAYSGAVWCLTVPLGNFMVRRRGTAHFSGNCWNDGMTWLSFVLKQAGNDPILREHGVRMELRFPKGEPIRIHARHDFPGHSQFNPLHGLRREHLFGLRDHVNIAGHKHVDSAAVVPSPDGYMQWMIRVSGYKAHDDYAKKLNLAPMKMAPTVGLLINPLARVPAEVLKPYWCLEEMADVLGFMRRRGG